MALAACCAACASAQGGTEAPGGGARPRCCRPATGERSSPSSTTRAAASSSPRGRTAPCGCGTSPPERSSPASGSGACPWSRSRSIPRPRRWRCSRATGCDSFAVSAWDWRDGATPVPRDARGRAAVPALLGRRQLAHARGVGLAGPAPARGRRRIARRLPSRGIRHRRIRRGVAQRADHPHLPAERPAAVLGSRDREPRHRAAHRPLPVGPAGSRATAATRPAATAARCSWSTW